MTTIYLNSNGGSDSYTGLSWAQAKATMQAAVTASNPASHTITTQAIVVVANTHSETVATSTVLSVANNARCQVICVNPSNNQQTTGAVYSMPTSGGGLQIKGNFFFNGVRIDSLGQLAFGDTGSSSVAFKMRFENCILTSGTNSSSYFFGTWNPVVFEFINCTFSFYPGYFDFVGCKVRFTNCTFSTKSGSSLMYFAFNGSNVKSICSNLPLKYPNTPYYGTISNFRLEEISCKNTEVFSTGPLNGVFFRRTYAGNSTTSANYRATANNNYVYSTTSVYKTASASALGTGYSLTFSTGLTNMADHVISTWSGVHYSTENIPLWNAATGTTLALAVEFLYDSNAVATNEEVWVEVYFKDTAGSSRLNWVSSRKVSLPGVSSDPIPEGSPVSGWTKGSASETWRTGRISAAITLAQAGYVFMKFKHCMSKSVYFDPNMYLNLTYVPVVVGGSEVSGAAITSNIPA